MEGQKGGGGFRLVTGSASSQNTTRLPEHIKASFIEFEYFIPGRSRLFLFLFFVMLLDSAHVLP
ncbi:MAG: hypothetical protein JWL90_4647 [Chthoniobacteraceae bacterium]|nr:hypothetical protein [Chthoniobacteraceae bacterium]